MNAPPAPPNPTAPPEERLIQAIDDYLAAHPHAADSAAGVARWWLAGRCAGASAQEVERALAAMVARQRLRMALLADGTTLYSRPAAH